MPNKKRVQTKNEQPASILWEHTELQARMINDTEMLKRPFIF